MEIQLSKNVASLSKIGKSNNSHIYSQLDSNKQPLGSALKIIVHKKKGEHSAECCHLHNEQTILSDLSHPNIINVSKKINNSCVLQKNEICCMEMELADCDLYDKMSKLYPKIIEPAQMRQVFNQLIRGVQYIHNKNIAHNDIKLENIFMFEGQTIPKLADFGFAKSFQPNASQQKQEWKSRCKILLAPEIINIIKNEKIEEFDEKKSDIFALGLTIFQAFMLRLPFEQKFACQEDKLYQAMYEGRFNDFWNQSEIAGVLKFLNKFEDFRKSQFIDLMNKMLATNPNDRPTIQQVVEHPWFTKVSTKNQCFIMF